MSDVDAASGISSGPPPYPDNSYGAYTRTRRKSIVTGPPQIESETSPDEKYHASGMSSSKGKKKRTRTSSFSLPFHQRRRRFSNPGFTGYLRWLASTKRELLNKYGLIALLAFAVLYGIYLLSRTYELQVEFSLFSYRWIKEEFDVVMPLRGCFDPQHVSPLYDMERHLAPKHQVLTPGVSLKRGTACYDFSSTVQSVPGVEPEHLVYHTYWRADLIPFGERHTATLASFLATQPLGYSKLILWTNGVEVISNNTHVRPFNDKWGDNIEVRQIDMKSLTKGTELEGILSGGDGGGLFDERAWVDGDAVRLLVLWHYGGVWMDMDQILTRDLHPLVEHEFVTQWDCYGAPTSSFALLDPILTPDKPYFSLNGALMHFRQHSPYLCEAFHIMASSPLPKPNTFTWGAHLYAKLHRRLLASHVKPFTVLPWCFADPRNCRSDIRFPDPFAPDPTIWGGRRWDGKGEVGRTGQELLEEKVGYVWTVHLHNQWRKEFPKGGWVERLLEGYQAQIDALEQYARTIGRKPSAAIASVVNANAGAGAGAGAGGVGAGGNANNADGISLDLGPIANLNGGQRSLVDIHRAKAGTPHDGRPSRPGFRGEADGNPANAAKKGEAVKGEVQEEEEEWKGADRATIKVATPSIPPEAAAEKKL